MREEQEVLMDGPLAAAWLRYGRDVTVVSLSGELDNSNVATARQAIADAVGADEEGQLLVVDLTGLEFIDSSGIALLVSLAGFGGSGGGLRIVPSAAPAVARVLTLTGIDSMVKVPGRQPRRGAATRA
ncbi:MAG TPA: STAS domain-containing protein [Solirubrobacterales bacterium]|nr:STAS domain-containing protein [Solirubrobacterales bacterium]